MSLFSLLGIVSNRIRKKAKIVMSILDLIIDHYIIYCLYNNNIDFVLDTDYDQYN